MHQTTPRKVSMLESLCCAIPVPVELVLLLCFISLLHSRSTCLLLFHTGVRLVPVTPAIPLLFLLFVAVGVRLVPGHIQSQRGCWHDWVLHAGAGHVWHWFPLGALCGAWFVFDSVMVWAVFWYIGEGFGGGGK